LQDRSCSGISLKARTIRIALVSNEGEVVGEDEDSLVLPRLIFVTASAAIAAACRCYYCINEEEAAIHSAVE
jgi:hypothetical protein